MVIKAMYNAEKTESEQYKRNGSCWANVYGGDDIWTERSYGYYGRIVAPLSYSENGISYFLSSVPLEHAVHSDGNGGNSATASFEIRTLTDFSGDTFLLHTTTDDDSLLDYQSKGVAIVSSGTTSGNYTYNLFEAGNVSNDAKYIEIICQGSGYASCGGSNIGWAESSASTAFSFIYLAMPLN